MPQCPSPDSRCRRKHKVAVIGTGLAGLTTAHLLQQDDRFEVHVFEKADRIGMSAASIEFQGQDGKRYAVDSPMRGIQAGYYRRLLKLYRKLGIKLDRADLDYSFFQLHDIAHSDGPSHSRQAQKTTTLLYNGKSGLSLHPLSFPAHLSCLPNTISHLRHLSHTFFSYFHLIGLALYHYHAGHTARSSTHWLRRATFAEFARQSNLPSSFRRDTAEPILANIATCSPEELDDYPAADLLEYMAKAFGRSQYTVRGGVKNAVERLLRDVPSQRIHTGITLMHVRRVNDTNSAATPRSSNAEEKAQNESLSPAFELESATGETFYFDSVVFATQANQAQMLLQTHYKSVAGSAMPSPELEAERRRIELLGKFPYTHSLVISHHDSNAVMPEHHRDWRALNVASWKSDGSDSLDSSSRGSEDTLIVPDERSKDGDSMRVHSAFHMATQDFSRTKSALRGQDGTPLFQTTNPTTRIDPEKMVSMARFERAVVTCESRDALDAFVGTHEQKGRFSLKIRRRKSKTEVNVSKKSQGTGGIHYVGAWAADGVPLLEGCVVSAERVARELKGSL